jgi:hypothetical protein
MEPQYMILGHAAGVAAYLAIRSSQPVHDVPIAELQRILRQQAAVYEYVATEQAGALLELRNLLRPPGIARFNWE